ncbi:MAG: hypothetical protein GX611_09760 [Clostridiales bacterium]|nr:hypothetical protein [Clostridiales bacterium]
MEYTKERLLTLARVLLFLAGVALVIWGQKIPNYLGLYLMLSGLTSLLILIYDYNSRNK